MQFGLKATQEAAIIAPSIRLVYLRCSFNILESYTAQIAHKKLTMGVYGWIKAASLRAASGLHGGQRVGIDAEGHLDPGVSQTFLHHMDRHTGLQEEGGTGMPQAVERNHMHPAWLTKRRNL